MEPTIKKLAVDYFFANAALSNLKHREEVSLARDIKAALALKASVAVQLADYLLGKLQETIQAMEETFNKDKNSIERYRGHNLEILRLLSEYEINKAAYNTLAESDPSARDLTESQKAKQQSAILLADRLFESGSFLFTADF